MDERKDAGSACAKRERQGRAESWNDPKVNLHRYLYDDITLNIMFRHFPTVRSDGQRRSPGSQSSFTLPNLDIAHDCWATPRWPSTQPLRTGTVQEQVRSGVRRSGANRLTYTGSAASERQPLRLTRIMSCSHRARGLSFRQPCDLCT